MQNLDRLKARILEEARERAARITADASARGERIVEDAQARAAKALDDVNADAAQTAAEEERRAAVSRSLNERNAVLRARGDMIDKLISELPGRIHQIDGKSYLGIMRRMMLDAAPDGKADVVVASSDANRITDGFIQGIQKELTEQGKSVSLRLAGHTDSISGGFLLNTESLEVNCSLDALVALSEDELAPLVAEALFGR